jgi:MOSC domain-containing protein YiiM
MPAIHGGHPGTTARWGSIPVNPARTEIPPARHSFTTRDPVESNGSKILIDAVTLLASARALDPGRARARRDQSRALHAFQDNCGTLIKPLNVLLDTLPQIGRVDWIGLRPAHRAEMLCVSEVAVSPALGLHGDRYAGRSRQRQVTLIQAEHLSVVASCLGREPIAPELLRRNIVVAGINLFALKGKRVCIGAAVLEVTGLCQPCSRMEELLGAGGYNAMRGHGGITAAVISAGRIAVGDPVSRQAATQ